MLLRLSKQIKGYIYVGLVAIMLSGCSSCKTQPDYNDKSSPNIEWTIAFHSNSNPIHKTGDASATVDYGKPFSVLAFIKDSGGVKKIKTVSPITSFSCESDTVVTRHGPTMGIERESDLGLDDDGEAWSKYVETYNFENKNYCDNGMTFSGGFIKLTYGGTNYNNKSAEATLEISIQN
ncbi:hypothetical protein [Fodinibius saliphilus]|uniref:hypothetical protein n=1 Tax=Fodinibius saliphilus TaxID=1920650 RepID=UPI0011089EF7|nr:hypothetical protein [Fodinibius saliphilus]